MCAGATGVCEVGRQIGLYVVDSASLEGQLLAVLPIILGKVLIIYSISLMLIPK